MATTATKPAKAAEAKTETKGNGKPLTSSNAPVSVRPGTEIIEMPNSNLQIKLGPDHSLILRHGPDGTVKKAAYATVRLSASTGDIAQIGYGDDAQYMICEGGYVKLNSVLGLDCRPASAEDSGINPNPYLVKDSAGNVSGVYVCYEVAGPDMKGNIATVRQTFFFNVRQYLVESMVSAATKSKNPLPGFTFQGLQYAIENPIPNSMILPIDERECLVIERGTPAYTKYLKDSIKLCKEADRRASTICRRLAFSRHPAIARTKPESVQNGIAEVNLIVWMVDEEAPKIVQEFRDDAGTLGDAAFDDTAVTAPDTTPVDPATGEFLGDTLFENDPEVVQ